MSASGDTTERLTGFGRWLARERELRGLGRDEVVRAMKLAPGVIEALESGEETRMPPRAYTVGYLRAYAATVGLDPDEVLLRFEEAIGPASPAVLRPPKPTPRRIAAVVVAAIVAAGAIWFLLHS